MEEIIATIKPKDHKFLFLLVEGTCYHLKNGRCSLSLTDDEISKITDNSLGGRNSIDYCRNIYRSLKIKQKKPVKLTRYQCGHIEFTDGQHRTCIAKHTDIDTLSAIVATENDNCNECKYGGTDYRIY
ncbi:hypothetical protein L5D93_23295 [Paenibacillus thiaminolyticus]|nr:hypothetical protein [Paenibacillus thiaminolyticus]